MKVPEQYSLLRICGERMVWSTVRDIFWNPREGANLATTDQLYGIMVEFDRHLYYLTPP